MADTEDQEEQRGDQAPEPLDEKEQLLQRRLARLEEALGLSPLT
ncbi:hypothetical protein LU674_013195 [Pseudomonas alloputida]|uniref:Uncharacterized protein n=2 Tax=Pseudomonas TaxID=286 RepID=A0AAJ5RWM8_9PSED|nr:MULTISPECIES: hypothetical protein [Pseudomonas]MDM3882124.1 hypothetical protein [Pseudomonas alloputida]MDM3953271.1 hypothetical protein [Pseudomonas alloputida]WEA18607.1 hypothetical protein PWA60_14945 [Pseudomonas juntendi]WJR15119.1 hypothetical protein LU682_018215 [Pseudomonas alloputida]WJR59914.1 hypothetical protein LU693_018145 [Pseudomonas alloputida]